MPSSGPILSVEGLSVSYTLKGKAIRAIVESSLHVNPTEAVGLVGESGSGKSSLARTVLGLLPQRVGRIDSGCIVINGEDVTRASPGAWERLRGHPIAIVFQDPLSYLNPVMCVGNQIAETVAQHDSADGLKARVEELLTLVKLPVSCVGSYPHQLSGGMRQRVLLAIALGCRPQLLIADEPTTALDVTTQAEILALLNELRHSLDMALLLISHDLAVVNALCSRIYVMYAGRTVEWGSTEAVFGRAAHPYTQALLKSARVLQDAEGRFVTIRGGAPNMANATVGCPLAPRCDKVEERCQQAFPPPQALGDAADHFAVCWRAG